MFQDKTIVCKDCGKEFVFTAGEQQFYAEKGFENDPGRCKDCRNAKKNKSRQKESFTGTCCICGGPATVPFIPRDPASIKCSNCMANNK